MAARKNSEYSTPLLVLMRLSLGWIMFWGFIDKLFGLGFTTKPEASWLNGGSPTTGFLKFGTSGPFAEFYQGLAGQMWVDWLFMAGLLGIGVAFLLGIAMRFAGYMGALMMILMFSAALLPEHNPVLDEHIVYALLFVYLPYTSAGETFGFSKQWKKTSVAKSLPFLA